MTFTFNTASPVQTPRDVHEAAVFHGKMTDRPQQNEAAESESENRDLTSKIVCVVGILVAAGTSMALVVTNRKKIGNTCATVCVSSITGISIWALNKIRG